MTPLQHALLAWYERNGRHTLPWREVRDPYRTLVSEFMLQQTQVDRVIPKFERFLEVFPDVRALAAGAKSDVLRLWQGLGYNSRAVRLKDVAVAVVERYGGVIPNDREALLALKGIGAYTASALRAFAFDLDDIALDTNIRRIAHRVFFAADAKVRARDLDVRAMEFVPPGRGHDANSALMDLGATLCTARAPKCMLCPLQSHCAAAPMDPATLAALRPTRKRSPQERIAFEATTRYARGRIVDRLRDLPPGAAISLLDLQQSLAQAREPHEIEALVVALERDGVVMRSGDAIRLSD